MPLIVGVGASAGGLEAFTQLLRALPPDTGMAFVLVQHLEPRHESMLTKLLSTATEMPATEVKQRMRVQANHVYVMPPNADIDVRHGVLYPAVRKALSGRHMPIDHFLCSLAEDQGARAIGVILSGTASDGTLGLKAIKVEGGVTFAQEPESAKFDGMPRSAIAAGCVDLARPPEGIAKELVQISRHPYVDLPPHEEAVPFLPAREEEFARILRLLRASSGVDFTYYKKTTIKRRIARRMALHKIERLDAYVEYLESNREELDALYQDILIHVTSFFREPDVFSALQATVLPQILAGKSAGDPVRIWVPGCSTGEEVYSIAICLLETVGGRATTPIQMFGTDISEHAIEKARSGVYPESALANVSRERLRRFFLLADGQYEIARAIREACVFSRHDVTKDPPFSRLDLISCRNLLIYLEPVLQRRVLDSFHYALKDTGFLLLGKSETLSGYTDLFTILDRKSKFFTKRAATAEPLYEWAPATHGASRPATRRIEEEPPFNPEREIDRMVWERYTHAGVVVSDELQILHFRGDTSSYLRPAPGKASFSLLRMLREELVYELRAAIHKARRGGVTVRKEGLRIQHNGRPREFSVEIRPLTDPTGRKRYFLILFEEEGVSREPQPKTAPPKKKEAESAKIQGLKNELGRTKEYLQTIIQDQEATNEELKSANEEAMSSMEELQSSNEELETAKEELQSANEELLTLNDQAQNRNAELAQFTDDLSNVLDGVNIPILMLGADRHIRRFTPSAEKLLHLRPTDVGRPIEHIRLGLAIPNLDDLVSQALNDARELKREVLADDGRWYSMRIRPYRTRERKIEGVLLALVDIHDLKQNQELARNERFVSAILDAAGGSLLVVVLDPEGKILHFNRACQELTGYSLEEVKGRRPWDFLLVPEEAAAAKTVFEQLLAGTPNQWENHWLTKDGRARLIAWRSTVTTADGGTPQYVIGTGIDVTERQQAREQLVESEATVRALLETAAQAILAVNREGRIVLANDAAEAMFGYRREEMLDRPVEALLPEKLRERHASHRAKYFMQPRNRPMGVGLDLVGRRRDGVEFPVEVSLSHVETGQGTLAVAFVTNITERKRAEDALRESEASARASQEQLRALTAGLLEAQEEERRRVARELHDDLNQRLALLAVEVGELEAQLPNSAGVVRDGLASVESRLNALSDDVRRTAYQLHPSILEHLGLAEALESYCADFSKQEAIKVRFRLRNVPKAIPEGVALCLYRVAQECLRNVAKHSGARQASVRLAGNDDALLLSVTDAGRGFDPASVRGKGGLGLISIEERVMGAGGTLKISARPGDGARVQVRIPLPGGSR